MKVVLITGASSGIGRATALRLASPETRLVLVARRGARLEELESEIRKAGGQATSIVADLTLAPAVERMIDTTAAEHGRIDVLINNAGVGYFGTVEQMPRELMDKILALNFVAPVLATQRVLPIMKAHRSGHIINVSSIAGKRGLPLSGIYCATKFALGGISEALRVELKDAGIHVSLVYPVATRTPFFDVVYRGDVRGECKPAGYIQPAEDVAKAIAKCVRRPRAEVYPYRPARLMVWFSTILPTVADRVLLPYVRERMRAEQ